MVQVSVIYGRSRTGLEIDCAANILGMGNVRINRSLQSLMSIRSNRAILFESLNLDVNCVRNIDD